MRELIDAFFRERSIVNHHIASFNDFLPTIDNPSSRMQRIVDSMRSSPEDDRRGVFKLDEDRTEGDIIEIRIGRRRDDRGRADLDAKPTISLEDLAPNRVLVEYNERYGRRVPVAKVFSQREGYRALTLVEMKKDGMLIVTVPTASGQIPLIILMRALGMGTDREISDAIVSVQEMANIVYANIEECQNKKL